MSSELTGRDAATAEGALEKIFELSVGGGRGETKLTPAGPHAAPPPLLRRAWRQVSRAPQPTRTSNEHICDRVLRMAATHATDD